MAKRFDRTGIVQRIADQEVRDTAARENDPHDEIEIAGMLNTAWYHVHTALGEHPTFDEVKEAIEAALRKHKDGTLGKR